MIVLRQSTFSWISNIFKGYPKLTHQDIKTQYKSGELSDLKNLIIITDLNIAFLPKGNCKGLTKWLRDDIKLIQPDNEVIDIKSISGYIPRPKEYYFYLITLNKDLKSVPFGFTYIQTPMEFLDKDNPFKFKSKK